MTGWVWALVATATTAGGSSEVLQALAPTSGGLTTEQVIERAIVTAPSVMRAEAQLAIREADASVAFLGFAPRIDTVASYTRLSPVVPDDPLLAMVFPKIENTYALRGSLSLPVSDWFLIGIPSYSATIHAEEAAAHQTRAAREAAAFRAVESFLNAVRARAAEVVVQRSVDVLAASHEDLVILVNAGVATEGDALQVKAQLATARVQLEQTKGLVQVTRETLRRSIHSDDVVLEHGEDLLGLVDQPPPEMKEALDHALAERAEVKALQGVIEVRNEQAARIFGSVFPKLSVEGQAEYAKPNQRTFYDPENFNGTWSVGVNLAWSPNDSVQAWSESNKAEQEVLAARADLAELSDGIAVEVANAVSSYRATRASIGAAQEAVEAAQGTFTDRQNLLNAGGGTTRELLLSEQDLRRAQLQLINAHLDLRLAQARLDRALGRLVKEAKP